MNEKMQRVYSFFLALGACILLFRTLRLIFFEGGFEQLVLFCILLTFVEMIFDVLCLVFSVRWFISSDSKFSSLPLRFGAIATIIHFVRVLIFVLGRTTVLQNFDVKEEYRSAYTMDSFWVVFAMTLSVLGIIGVIVIGIVVKKNSRKVSIGK